ncbi:MAG: alpha/beta hydrolase [Sulfitobacter sp.]|nr:alpha/beta hydrolase [Sulfitobacter sp.]
MGQGCLSKKTDYNRLIDAEMWAYIRRLDATYPPNAVSLDVAGQRRLYDEMCAIFRQPRPEGVEVEEVAFGGVPCRSYVSGDSNVTVIYYHGGGFIVGGLDSHDDVCAEICDRTGYRVISVDYSLAPETVFPGCFNDAWSAFGAICEECPDDIVLCGDSAGGKLAASVAHHARGRIDGRVIGQVLIYPGFGGDITKGSYVTHAEAPHLTLADIAFYRDIRLGGAERPTDDPRYSALLDTDFTGVPPTVIVTAECDPVSSDGETYRDLLRDAGVPAHWSEVKGMVHACLRARNMSQKAAGFFDEVVEAVAALGKGEWPYAPSQPRT